MALVEQSLGLDGPQVFPSKIDHEQLFWSLATVGSALAAALFALASHSVFGWVLAALLCVVGAGLPLWVLVSTRYTVARGQLQVRSGPFAWAVPLDAIVSVRASNSPIASPALSLDRLELVLTGRRAILVSPRDKRAFTRAIGVAATL